MAEGSSLANGNAAQAGGAASQRLLVAPLALFKPSTRATFAYLAASGSAHLALAPWSVKVGGIGCPALGGA